MTARPTIAVAIAFLTLLTGCYKADPLAKAAPPEDERYARAYAEQLRHREYAEIKNDLSEGIFATDVNGSLTAMSNFFPAEEPLSIKVVGVQYAHNGDTYDSEIALEYEFPSRWLITDVRTHQSGDTTWITNLSVVPLNDSLENSNSFSLKSGGNQYIVLLLLCGSAAISIAAFVICLRTPLQRAKWFWLIACFVGVGRLGVNWTTGSFFGTPFALFLPTFNVVKHAFQPWLVSASLPLGALVFLAVRSQLELRSTSEASPSASVESNVHG